MAESSRVTQTGQHPFSSQLGSGQALADLFLHASSVKQRGMRMKKGVMTELVGCGRAVLAGIRVRGATALL